MALDMLPIFAIALKESTERRQHLSDQMNALDLNFEFIDAVYGKDISQAEKQRLLAKKRQKFHPSPMSDGALGCYLSHRLIWQKIVDEKIEMALILEDDAALKPEAIDVLKRIEKLAGRFDIINLHHTTNRVLVDVAQLSKTHRLTMTRYNAIVALGYVITKEAAEKLLARSIPVCHELDIFTNRWWDHGLRTMVVRPPVASEAGLSSTIGYPSQKPVWPDDRFSHRLARRFNRAKDSFVKRRSFAAMVMTAKMRLMGTDPKETLYNPEFPDLIKLTDPE